MPNLKISAVSYLNTLPFIYGLKQSSISNKIDLELDMPSDCAEKLLTGKVDIGLVPISILPQLEEHYILSDYCIGAEGKVNSVLLLSDVPLNEIEEIHLDYQSRTSVNLVQVLANEYWKISPIWKNTTKGFEDQIEGKKAGVIIGDRTFHLKKEYKYRYDLPEEWKKFTGLPFVFACWVANKEVDKGLIQEFNSALQYGVDRIDDVIRGYDGADISKTALFNYLKNDISYHLDENKQIAIKKFLNYLNTNKVVSLVF